MSNQVKNIVVTVLFTLFAGGFFILCLFHTPVETSQSERRPLSQFPTDISWESIIDKTTITELEDYTVDQFPLREWFRSLKANFQLNVLQIKENNGLAVEDGYIAKIEGDFNETIVLKSLNRLSYVYDKYLKDNGGNKYLSITPDKNYFFARDYGYPGPDYGKLAETAANKLSGMEYIDLFDVLSLEDYYYTDTHWKQENLDAVVDRLAGQMGCGDRLSKKYETNTLYPFYGVYHGQSALNPEPDTLTYLTNDILASCTVYDYETGKTEAIYNFDKFENSSDGYDFFLSGTRALLRIDNPNAATDEELIIFRDSFGSSITPLLAEGYRSVYLVDIRYIAPDLLGNFIDFQDKDVLFLYSALILNSNSLK